jgi:hypothetical protein
LGHISSGLNFGHFVFSLITHTILHRVFGIVQYPNDLLTLFSG